MDRPKARPLRVDDSVAEGLRKMGVPEDQIAAQLAKAQKDVEDPRFDFEVYEECWRTVMLFLKVRNQWLWRVHSRPAGFGALVYSVRVGLNYQAVESTLRMVGVPRREWAQLLEELQVMEEAVLKAEAA